MSAPAPVIFNGFSITGADAGDYTLNPPPSNQTANITPAPLVITASNQNRALRLRRQDAGTNASLGTTDFTLNTDPRPHRPHRPHQRYFHPDVRQRFGHLGDPVHQRLASTSLNYNVALPARPWTITPSSPVGSGLSNYLIDPTTGYIPGTLAIFPKDLTVTAHNKSRSYGDVNPASRTPSAASSTVTSSTVHGVGIAYYHYNRGGPGNAGIYAITIIDYGSLNYTDPNDVNYTFVNSIQRSWAAS